jgi:hypothetical protein
MSTVPISSFVVVDVLDTYSTILRLYCWGVGESAGVMVVEADHVPAVALAFVEYLS